ncbi:MAG: response regulator [Nitrospira sp.]|nr:response regulator [Nitrospira sp.]
MPKHILVVDDDPDIRQILQDRLDSYGYLTETVADGWAAIRALERNTPSGIFLDLRMPGMDGLEVLGHIRDLLPSIPVIIATAAGTPEQVNVTIRAGAQAWLRKPFDTLQIKQVADRWFANPHVLNESVA